MARKPTDKQLFKMKNEWLGQFYEEVKPKDFYRAVFPEGSFEREGHPEDEKCNGVLTVIEGEKARKGRLQAVQEVQGVLLLSKKIDCCHSEPTEQAPHPNGEQSIFYSSASCFISFKRYENLLLIGFCVSRLFISFAFWSM